MKLLDDVKALHIFISAQRGLFPSQGQMVRQELCCELRSDILESCKKDPTQILHVIKRMSSYTSSLTLFNGIGTGVKIRAVDADVQDALFVRRLEAMTVLLQTVVPVELAKYPGEAGIPFRSAIGDAIRILMTDIISSGTGVSLDVNWKQHSNRVAGGGLWDTNLFATPTPTVLATIAAFVPIASEEFKQKVGVSIK